MTKKIIFIIPVLLLLFTLSGCTVENNSNNEIARKQEQLMKESNNQIGMPAIVNFQEKKLAKMIFELRDREDLQTYTYIKSDYNGSLTFFCNSIGYGLPYSVQYTNPEVDIFYTTSSAAHMALPQADPNGLFMPDGLSATWVMCIDNKGEARPVYVEPEIVVSPFKLK